MGVVLSYPRVITNANWNVIANLAGNISVNDGRKKVEVSCSYVDLNALANALRSYKKQYRELTTTQKDQSATITIKTNFEYEARNIGADLLAIQNAGPIITIPKKDPDDNNGKKGGAITESGDTINNDGTLSQEDIDKQKTQDTINSVFSKRNIIIGVVVIIIGVVAYMIFKRKK